jgi:hypothetical protein
MGIGKELEGVDQMRFEPEGTPDAAHATRGLVSAALSTSIRRSSWSGTGRRLGDRSMSGMHGVHRRCQLHRPRLSAISLVGGREVGSGR